MTRTILLPLDGSALADSAAPHAVELARRFGAQLRVVRVHQPLMQTPVSTAPLVVPDPGIEEEILSTRRAWLEKRAHDIRASSGLNVIAEFRVGLPGEEIVAAADACDAACIVCTTHGTGGWALHWFGSVADGIIRHTSHPVLAMSAAAVERTTTPQSILVLLDGSETSAAILPEVVRFATAFDARVDLFRVVIPPWVGDVEIALPLASDRFGIDAFAEEAKHELEAVARALHGHGVRVTSAVEINGLPTRRILEYIETSAPDMVALATHGRGITRLLVGSVADKVLRAGARPMLCVRPPHGGAAAGVRSSSADAAGVPAPHTA